MTSNEAFSLPEEDQPDSNQEKINEAEQDEEKQSSQIDAQDSKSLYITGLEGARDPEDEERQRGLNIKSAYDLTFGNPTDEEAERNLQQDQEETNEENKSNENENQPKEEETNQPKDEETNEPKDEETNEQKDEEINEQKDETNDQKDETNEIKDEENEPKDDQDQTTTDIKSYYLSFPDNPNGEEGLQQDQEATNEESKSERNSTQSKLNSSKSNEFKSSRFEVAQGVPSIVQSIISDLKISDLPPLEADPSIEARCLTIHDEFIKDGKLPPTGEREMFCQFLTRQKINALIEKRYKDAKKSDTELKEFKEKVATENQGDTNLIEEIRKKIEIKRNQLTSIEEEKKEKADIIKDRFLSKKTDMKKSQEQELEVLETKWNDENFLKKFAKASTRLLSEMELERNLVLTNSLDSAINVRTTITEMEEQESINCQKRAETTLKTQKRNIFQKNLTRTKVLEDCEKEEFDRLDKRYHEKMGGCEKRIGTLEQRIIELKKGSNLPPLKARPLQKATSQSPPPPKLITPRTTFRYALYRSVKPKPNITVKPLGKILTK